MPITPGGRFSPGDSDDWDLTTDLAAMQVSNETATATEITAAINGILPTRYIGTEAQRAAMTAPNLRNGIEFQSTDGPNYLTWQRRNGGWYLAPGQVLAVMTGPASNITGAGGTLAGSIISTPTLSVGQRVKIMSNYSQYNVGNANSNYTVLRARNNAADVSFTVADMVIGARGYSSVTSGVHDTVTPAGILTTTVAAKVSAAVYLASATTGIYGQDGFQLWIESA